MKIGIDASRAFLKQRTGIEEYSYQVIKHLRRNLAREHVVLYVKKSQISNLKSQIRNAKFKDKTQGREKDIFVLPKNWRARVISWPRLWTQGGLSWEMLRRPVDVLFVPAHTVPWMHPKKTIVTIHGLEYEIFPKAYSLWERLYMRWSIRLSCRFASKIIAVSKNTKKDLIRLYRIPEKKIEVVYEGYETVNREQGTVNREQKKKNTKYEIPNTKYVLFIGRIETRKNVQGILEAFEILKTKYDIPHKLILVGKPGFGYQNLKSQISNLKSQEDVIELGYISEKEKSELLESADAFLFPSLYEGFGLPILEAQSVGVPVVTSNTSSLVEIAGKSALLVDPLNVEDIVKAIHILLTNTKKREHLIALGYENSKRFSWEKCAHQIARKVV